MRAGVLEAEQISEEFGAAVRVEDDRAQPSADDGLIAAYIGTGAVEERRYRGHRFTQRYGNSEIELLAEVDEAHENGANLQLAVSH